MYSRKMQYQHVHPVVVVIFDVEDIKSFMFASMHKCCRAYSFKFALSNDKAIEIVNMQINDACTEFHFK